MRRLDLIIQTEGLEKFLHNVLDCKCDYCVNYDITSCKDDACCGDQPCSDYVMEYLTQEMVIDFDEITYELVCKDGCEPCVFKGKSNCKTLYLWSTFGKVL